MITIINLFINITSIEAVEKSVTPLIKFNITLQYQPQLKIILNVTGEMLTASGIFLSKLEQIELQQSSEFLLKS